MSNVVEIVIMCSIKCQWHSMEQSPTAEQVVEACSGIEMSQLSFQSKTLKEDFGDEDWME